MPRIDTLRNAAASVRFLSVEPLLEDLGEIDLDGIHWVIVGGESGRVRQNEGSVGNEHPRAMRRCRSSVLLQAVGGREEIRDRAS